MHFTGQFGQQIFDIWIVTLVHLIFLIPWYLNASVRFTVVNILLIGSF